jgi:hypothetical protein
VTAGDTHLVQPYSAANNGEQLVKTKNATVSMSGEISVPLSSAVHLNFATEENQSKSSQAFSMLLKP